MGKLVRDRIPEIMIQQGKEPGIEQIDGERLRLALKDKLVEEASELREAGDITEELADVLEVIDALVEAFSLDYDAVRKVQANKKASRGGFSRGYYLTLETK